MPKAITPALLLALAAAVPMPALAQSTYTPPTGPINLPRNLTAEERAYLKLHPLWTLQTDAPTPPPTGPNRCVAEYENMDGLVIVWSTTAYSAGIRTIVEQIVRRTTVDANRTAYVVVSSSTQQTSATTALAAAGANLSRVRFVLAGFNTVWMRDYGPRYNYEGPLGNQVRTIVDHQYNRPRPADDAFPVAFSTYMNHNRYELGASGTTLIHGGGNFHLDAANRGYATRLVDNENAAFNEAQIANIWLNYQALNMTFFDGFPTTVDSTQHLDMWMQIIADDKVIISDWPNNPGSTQDIICDNAALLMAGRGYTVTRVPAYSISGVHYTFTNMVMLNNIVIVPQYNNGPGATISANAASTIQSAIGAARTVIPLNADSIVGQAGVFHCIVMHVPEAKGAPGSNGRKPTAYLRAPVGGETYAPGTPLTLAWITDDDKPAGPLASGGGGVATITLALSTDDGATFPTNIFGSANALGSFNWTIPTGINTAQARIRITAMDGDINTGTYITPAFTIGNPAVACYANCDGSTDAPVLGAADFSCFLNRYRNSDAYANCDGSTDAPVLGPSDFSCFLNRYRAGC